MRVAYELKMNEKQKKTQSSAATKIIYPSLIYIKFFQTG